MRGSAFVQPQNLTADQWLTELQQQVVNQAGSGNGYLFSVPSSEAALTVGSALPAALLNEFYTRGYSLSSSATVTANGTGSWVLRDSHYVFLLQPATNGMVSVSRLVAGLPTSLAGDLNAGTIDGAISGALSSAGFPLSTDAVLTVDKSGQQWHIVDGQTEYDIQLQGSVLAVTGDGGLISDLKVGVIRIDAGAEILLDGTPADVFSTKGDVAITSDGKILISGITTFADGALTANTWLYADLSQTASAGTATIYFLGDLVQKSSNTVLGTVAASAVFESIDANGNVVPRNDPSANGFEIALNGTYTLGTPIFALQVDGGATLQFFPDHFKLDFSGDVSIVGLVSVQDALQAPARSISPATESTANRTGHQSGGAEEHRSGHRGAGNAGAEQFLAGQAAHHHAAQ